MSKTSLDHSHPSDLYFTDTDDPSNSISKGREEKRRKHSASRPQNKAKTVFPNLQACACPNGPTVTYQRRMGLQGRSENRKTDPPQTRQTSREADGKPMEQSRPVMCQLPPVRALAAQTRGLGRAPEKQGSGSGLGQREAGFRAARVVRAP